MKFYFLFHVGIVMFELPVITIPATILRVASIIHI